MWANGSYVETFPADGRPAPYSVSILKTAFKTRAEGVYGIPILRFNGETRTNRNHTHECMVIRNPVKFQYILIFITHPHLTYNYPEFKSRISRIRVVFRDITQHLPKSSRNRLIFATGTEIRAPLYSRNRSLPPQKHGQTRGYHGQLK